MNQSKDIHYNEWSNLAKLSEKFMLAIGALKQNSSKNTSTKIASKTKEYLEKMRQCKVRFDSSYVTNYSKIFKINPKEENPRKEGIFLDALEFLDSRILTECGLKWDADSREYIESKDTENLAKYKALVGNYYGYTLDIEVPGTNLKENFFYIHKFKVQIVDRSKIILITKTATFKSTEIRMLTDSKLSFRIVNEDHSRTVWFVVLIENRGPNDLKRKLIFKSGYLDSGSSKIKSGRALLERATDEEFDSFTPKSLHINNFPQGIISGYIKYLKHSQSIID